MKEQTRTMRVTQIKGVEHVERTWRTMFVTPLCEVRLETPLRADEAVTVWISGDLPRIGSEYTVTITPVVRDRKPPEAA